MKNLSEDGFLPIQLVRLDSSPFICRKWSCLILDALLPTSWPVIAAQFHCPFSEPLIVLGVQSINRYWSQMMRRLNPVIHQWSWLVQELLPQTSSPKVGFYWPIPAKNHPRLFNCVLGSVFVTFTDVQGVEYGPLPLSEAPKGRLKFLSFRILTFYYRESGGYG